MVSSLSSRSLSSLLLAVAATQLLLLLPDSLLVHAFSPALCRPFAAQASGFAARRQQQQQQHHPLRPGYFRPLRALEDDLAMIMGEDDDNDIDSPPAEDYIVKAGELEGDEPEEGAVDDGEVPAWAESARRVEELRIEHRRHEKDTGSPEYQVAGMTERIRYLTGHLQAHPTDYSTRRGLVALVNKRRRLLNYLSREDAGRYRSLVASLGIRHKASGRVPDRSEKYGRFPPQKAAKKHVVG